MNSMTGINTTEISISGLAHIGIRVSDFKSAIGFYSQLGFKLIRDDMYERVVVLKHSSGIEINLLDSVNSKVNDRNVLMDQPVRFAGYTHMALRVDDVYQSADAIRAMDIEITEGPVTFGDGSTSIFLRDPDRNVIELSQPLQVDKLQDDVSHNDVSLGLQKESVL